MRFGDFKATEDTNPAYRRIKELGLESRPIQKSRVVSTGIGTASIEGSGSTRRGVPTTPRHAADGPTMSGECRGGVPIRSFPPDGCARALGCRGAAERRTASLGEWAAQGCPAARMASRASCGRAA